MWRERPESVSWTSREEAGKKWGTKVRANWVNKTNTHETVHRPICLKQLTNTFFFLWSWICCISALLDLFYLLFFPPNSLILFAAGFIEAACLWLPLWSGAMEYKTMFILKNIYLFFIKLLWCINIKNKFI